MAETRLWEGKHAGHFIVSEAGAGGSSGSSVGRSREQVTLPANTAAMVVGSPVVVDAGTGAITVYAAGDTPSGILFDNTTESTGTQEIVLLVRDCEVNGAELNWDAALTNAEKLTAIGELNKLGIIVR